MRRALSSSLLAIAFSAACLAAQDPAVPKPAAPPPKAKPPEAEPMKPAAPAPKDPKAKDHPAKPAAPDPKDPATPRDVSQFNLGDGGLALGGYDPVAYFPDGGGKAKEGKESLELRFRGATYRFASEENKKAFAADPLKYEPAYGGWCAYGMAKGDKVEIDPESFLIVDGKLMVFYDGFLADTRAKWQDEGASKLQPKADATWSRYVGEAAGKSDK
jgi:YHS domain-containing protein